MNWYIAKIVFQIICDDGKHQPQFDEQLRMIRAVNEADAYKRAHAIGNFEQDDFCTEEGKRIHWKFIGVPELFPMISLKDGAELYSTIHEPGDADAYTGIISQRALRLSAVKAKAVSDNSFVNADTSLS